MMRVQWQITTLIPNGDDEFESGSLGHRSGSGNAVRAMYRRRNVGLTDITLTCWFEDETRSRNLLYNGRARVSRSADDRVDEWTIGVVMWEHTERGFFAPLLQIATALVYHADDGGRVPFVYQDLINPESTPRAGWLLGLSRDEELNPLSGRVSRREWLRALMATRKLRYHLLVVIGRMPIVRAFSDSLRPPPPP